MKLGATIGIILGITSGVGAILHGNSTEGSLVWALDWLFVLVMANAFES
jgi:hypothetical protein